MQDVEGKSWLNLLLYKKQVDASTNMTKISSSILIDAPPSKVKELFFDFESYPSWNSFVTSIKGNSQEVGSILEVEILPPGSSKQQFKPKIVENSDTKFGWVGVLGSEYIFKGYHQYEFISVENGTRTKLVQSEDFSGFLSVPLLYLVKDSTLKGFENLNDDLKKKVEGS